MLYIVSAPSGTGKSSLIQELLKTNELIKNTQVSRSYTTRVIRNGEVNKKNYFFVSMNEFKNMITKDAFIEYAYIFGHYYGTSRAILEHMLTINTDIILDIDWQGAQQIRKKISNNRSIFILPPSREELNYRLQKRGQDSQQNIAQRIIKAVEDISHYVEYDYLIINDNFNVALLDFKNIVLAERLQLKRQKLRYDVLINNLLENHHYF